MLWGLHVPIAMIIELGESVECQFYSSNSLFRILCGLPVPYVFSQNFSMVVMLVFLTENYSIFRVSLSTVENPFRSYRTVCHISSKADADNRHASIFGLLRLMVQLLNFSGVSLEIAPIYRRTRAGCGPGQFFVVVSCVEGFSYLVQY